MFFRCNAIFSPFTVVSVLMLLITHRSPSFPFLSAQHRVCRVQESKKSIYDANPKKNIHDAVRDGELLMVQDFLLAEPTSVNQQRWYKMFRRGNAAASSYF